MMSLFIRDMIDNACSKPVRAEVARYALCFTSPFDTNSYILNRRATHRVIT